MTSAPASNRVPRRAVLGQLPRMYRADGSAIRVLLVDDERALTNLVRMALRYEGWEIDVAHNAAEAVEKYRSNIPDVIVLDIMLPDMDGLGVLAQIRDSGTYTPTLFLTARDSVADRVGGLTAGGDDYMTKPFSLEELVARLRGLLRRTAYLTPTDDESLSVGDLKLDAASREVTRGGVPIALTSTEFELLRFLMRNPRRALSRQEILRRVWDYDFGGRSSIVDLYVSYLRKKIDTNHEPMIHTVRGRIHAAATGMKRFWQNWSLLRQLVVGVCAVVMVVLVTVGTMSVVTLRSSVLGIIDTQLSGAADGFSQSVTKYRTTPLASGEMPAPGTMKPMDRLIGQAEGNVVALIQNGEVVDSAHFVDGEGRPLPPQAVERIAQVSWDGTEPRTVKLPGLDWYRMEARPGDRGELLITGVSRTPAWNAMVRETVIVSSMTALALLVTALSTVAIVRLALRPLRRVSATAAEVATLPLDRDNYAITPRVPDRDTDPRTEVGLVGDTLNRLLDHVERALADVAASDRRMRQFITDASHELRTPLAAINGYAELTRQDSSVLPETTEYSLARIEAEAHRMSSLVADLLLLARLDEGHDLENASVSLTDVVADAVNDAKVSAPTHSWLMNVPDAEVWVRGDRARLHQTLAVLLSNARVHTPDGTTVTTTVVTGRSDDGTAYVEMTVSDDGPGIDSELLPHLFERFVRADKSRSREAGSFGLGLSIAASIIEAHGGTITAQSLPGRTAFSVRLPTAAAPAQHATST